MSERLYYSSIMTIFVSLLLAELTNLPINSFNLTCGDRHEVDFLHRVDHVLSTISIPIIRGESDTVSIVPHPIIDEVHPDNLQKTVRDLASFHTRPAESEFIDGVAY